MWKKAALGTAFFAAIAAPQVFHVVRAAPEPGRAALPAQVAAGKTFAGTCKADEIGDTRPAPAWVGASFEHDNCWAPQMPVRLNGRTAKREEIVAAMAAAKRYAVQSEAYQRCISDFVAVRKARAGGTQKPVNWPLIVIENHRIFVAQENKKKADRQVEVAINAFNEYGSGCPDQ